MERYLWVPDVALRPFGGQELSKLPDSIGSVALQDLCAHQATSNQAKGSCWSDDRRPTTKWHRHNRPMMSRAPITVNCIF